MNAMDLRTGSPRRWSESIEGIVWLPRLIDKTRAAHAGTLGPYLFGQSPMDRGLLHSLGIGHTEFARIVARSADDDAVIAALGARDANALERARTWGARLKRKHAWFLFVLDVDDGYAGGFWNAVKLAVTPCANAFTWAVKRVWPSRAIERSRHP